ncbi:MAG TPA: TonB-dependent receptor [Gemmatimonadota bacterium]|nr:TonB-dependent receptor [Gemmatimonadota bacterium]
MTTAAIQGRVTADPGSAVPLDQAVVSLTNNSTGHRWEVRVGEQGHYFVETVPVGGPYTIQVDAPGFQPTVRSGVVLALGQRLITDFALEATVFEVEPITVTADSDPRINAARTGPAQTIDRSQLDRLPVLSRNVLALVRESPLANRGEFGVSIGGQDPRSNSFQVDGAVNNNFFGRFSATPGGLVDLVGPQQRTIPLDAVKEVQVVASPFDVRQGGFAGGLINVVTRSGTNSLGGFGFLSLQDDALVGEDFLGSPAADFTAWQFGGTLEGPLVRDRLHFFVATDLQPNRTPYAGPLIGTDTTAGADSAAVGIRRASALRFQEILRERYGVIAGDFGPVDGHTPVRSVFGKASLQLATNSLLEVSQSYAYGFLQGFFLDREQSGNYDLSSADIRFANTTSATRANWNALLGGRFSNELILAYLRIRDDCRPNSSFPHVIVDADQGFLKAGDKFSCWPASGIDQDALELTENLTFGLGAQRITVGAHVELLHLEGRTGAGGQWSFQSLDSLDQGIAAEYFRVFAGPEIEGPAAEFRVRQVGAYLQDQWTPSAGLTLTAGLRIDAPFFPETPTLNAALREELGIDTRVIPSGNVLWSPRLGFNYDLWGRGSTTLRGGAGLFAGRPPYFFVAQAYRSTGLEELTLFCAGEDVPAFTIDLARQPTECRASGPAAVPKVAFFDPDFRFPQNLKLAFGVDHRLPWGLVATADFLYTRAVHQLYFRDVNLLPPVAVAVGEGGRALYGSIDPASGIATPRRRSPDFGAVIEQTNRSGDNGFSVTAQVQKRFGGRLGLNASYTWSRTRTLLSLSGLGLDFTGLGVAAEQLASTPLDGTLERQNLRPPLSDIPHSVRLSGTLDLPYGVNLALVYDGASGDPYTYVIEGDANGDGFGAAFFNIQNNDIAYVPQNAAPGGDISLVVFDEVAHAFVPAPPSEYTRLEAYIRSEACLHKQRGTILRRNSCRDPWRSSLDMRLSKAFPTRQGQSLEITADIFNLLNFLHRDWGLIRRSAFSGFESFGLFTLTGFDPVNGRGVYSLNLPETRVVDGDASRWRMQISMRYAF